MTDTATNNDSTIEPDYMVTTTDNPYNPFVQYDEWRALDEGLGYYTTGLLARYVVSSDELSDADQALAITEGINDLLQDNPFGMYRKVSADFYKNTNA